jgi:hypothetical protein
VGKTKEVPYIAARQWLLENLRCQLLGPGAEPGSPDIEHEILTDSPAKRYQCGILYPRQATQEGSRDDDTSIPAEEVAGEVDIEDGAPEDTVCLANQWFPSSMGITFSVEGELQDLLIGLSFATYRKLRLDDCCYKNQDALQQDDLPEELEPYLYLDQAIDAWRVRSVIDKDEWSEMKGKKSSWSLAVQRIFDALSRQCISIETGKGYIREPHHIAVKLDNGIDEGYHVIRERIDGTYGSLAVLCHMLSEEKDRWSISLMMTNEYKDSQLLRYDCFIFQPRLKVVAPEGTQVRFVDRHHMEALSELAEEEQRLELLYRNQEEYASGMGTSVGWDIEDDGSGKVWNEFIPDKELPSMDFNLIGEDIPASTLSMKVNSDLDGRDFAEKVAGLEHLVAAYERWIGNKEVELESIPSQYHAIAKKNIAACRLAADRMKSGIDFLKKDENVRIAYELANRAMFMQRVHLGVLGEKSFGQDRYPGEEHERALQSRLEELMEIQSYVSEDDVHTWRPFQLAFLLMSIQGIVDEDSEDRELLDLIWFPTGGGKTEAYLGLSAFVIFYRRLAYPGEAGGTNIIMRYTLRLLTAQQFSRAATLICACERIRMGYGSISDRSLGDEKITIGLWIGNDHTPNRMKGKDGAIELLARLQEDDVEARNPFQLLKCPWCGTKLVKENRKGSWGYGIHEDIDKFYFYCPQHACHFHASIPVCVIDEDLYSQPPTLLIGTVDKFAMMAWKEEVNRFFGIWEGKRLVRGPELIIQDELHLISGPLGSIVGLYESAVDYICQHFGQHRPKMIASTATIRRAEAQCAALYDRKVCQFPPPGLEASDSFFAKEMEVDHEQGIFGRTYVGIMGAGVNKASMEVSMITDLLQLVQKMDVPDQVKDAYWTLTGYFNTLKELGQCKSLVEDDVISSQTQFAKMSGSELRKDLQVRELTSRVSTTRLNHILDSLERVHYTSTDKDTDKPIDVLLSSNMISVGIDVDRLNIMQMVGQPKLTSEYIQASSRVGRKHPGIVFALYDQGRSRDRSYYEQFKMFHGSFYRFVEPTGATPFSKPARDRALHAVLIAILRNIPGLLGENNAVDFRNDGFEKEIDEVKAYIVRRVEDIRRIGDIHVADDRDDIMNEMDRFFARWNDIASQSTDGLVYGMSQIMGHNPARHTVARLMKPFHQDSEDTVKPFETLTSMRNVDYSISGSVLIWEE